MREAEMALVWSSVEEGKLRMEIVDDSPSGHRTVCVLKIDACDIGGLLAGRRSAAVELTLPEATCNCTNIPKEGNALWKVQ